jgi:3',5'-cyclic AMP phosphodiesterase CpdA
VKHLAFFALAAAASAADLTFIQMSDPQFGMFTENHDFAQETVNFEKAIAAANKLKPAFVVVTGDLVNQAGNGAQIAEYLRVSKELDRAIPIHHVAGNHDVGNEPTPDSLALYRKKFGPDYYVFRYGDFLGIVLNSSLIQHPAGAPEESAKQFAWLQSELKKVAPRKRVAIFQHIPYFLKDSNEADDYFNIPLATRTKYLELFESHNVVYCFAGHYHRNALGDSGGFQMVTTGPVGKPLGKDPSGFRVVTVRGATMESKYQPL